MLNDNFVLLLLFCKPPQNDDILIFFAFVVQFCKVSKSEKSKILFKSHQTVQRIVFHIIIVTPDFFGTSHRVKKYNLCMVPLNLFF